MCNRTQNDAIWGLIALFLANQIAGNTIDFKMNVISNLINYFFGGVIVISTHYFLSVIFTTGLYSYNILFFF